MILCHSSATLGLANPKNRVFDWAEVDLNHRHTDFQSVALPTELPARIVLGRPRTRFAIDHSLRSSQKARRRPTKSKRLLLRFCGQGNLVAVGASSPASDEASRARRSVTTLSAGTDRFKSRGQRVVCVAERSADRGHRQSQANPAQ